MGTQVRCNDFARRTARLSAVPSPSSNSPRLSSHGTGESGRPRPTTGKPPYDLVMPDFSSRYRFRDWPDGSIPDVAAGLYAIWREAGELVYVGMSGRGMESRTTTGKRFGMWTRLASHASGRLSGDQFCVYVANRYVIPELTASDLPLFASGDLNLDGLTKSYIRTHFSYSFALTESSLEAHDLERDARRGLVLGARPTLNPLT